MKTTDMPDGFHPGDVDSTNSITRHSPPRHMKFGLAEHRTTRLATVGMLFIIIALFACLAMWLATLGPFTGAEMVVPGRLF